MYEFYNISDNDFIAYKRYKSKTKNLPTIIFLHGLMSDLTGSKATALYEYCKSRDLSFIAFDNFGHGKSSGAFVDQTIGRWLSGLIAIIKHFAADNGAILVGSSAGAWIALLGTIALPKLVKGLICIAAAPDFTEDIWKKLSEEERAKMQKDGSLVVTSVSGASYQISYNLISEGREHLLLNQNSIEIDDLPVRLIHGVKDEDVPCSSSKSLHNKITSKQIKLKIIEDGNHRLSTPDHIKIITDSLEEVLAII